MASLDVGQDVANKRERKETAAHIVAKSIAVRLRRYGSLIKSNPLAHSKCIIRQCYCEPETFTMVFKPVCAHLVIFSKALRQNFAA